MSYNNGQNAQVHPNQQTQPSIGAIQTENQNAQRAGDQYLNGGTNSATGHYMTIGAVGGEKGAHGGGSALAQRSANRGPNSAAVQSSFYADQQAHSATSKIRGNSYTPMVERGHLREQSQNNTS